MKRPASWEWPWLVWAFLQPPGGGLPDQRCIVRWCWRPFIYDGFCIYHNHLLYREG